MRRIIASIFGIMALIALVACDSAGQTACESATDCADGEQCYAGQCMAPPACVIDNDCPYGSFCSGGRCQAATVCSSWEDCAEDHDCIDGTCRPYTDTPSGCTSSDDCGDDQYCELDTGICMPKQNNDGDVPDGDTPDGDNPDGDKPDGDTPDGDTPDGDTPDGDTPDGDQPDGDISYGNLCQPCSSDTACNSNGLDKCLEDSSQQTFCARDCDPDNNPCPPGYSCNEIFGAQVLKQCQPTGGSCADAPDGDTPDGDTPDGDQPDGDDPCSGSCVATMVDVCYGSQLCTCNSGQFRLVDCVQVCREGGYAGYDHCGYANSAGEDICYCTGASDGDTPDGDQPDGDEVDYCTGYTGINPCCANGDPCSMADDDWCDCNGACAWDTNDCTGGETCAGYDGLSYCCATDDPCGMADDGYCDCDGACGWDEPDCGAQDTYCPGYQGTSNCCTPDNNCGYANDDTCDCDGTCSWDSTDCSAPSEVQCGACPTGDECATGYVCVSYTNGDGSAFCVKDCAGGASCPAGSSCYEDSCVPDVDQAWCASNDLNVIDTCQNELLIACDDANEICNAQELMCESLGTDGDEPDGDAEPCSGACDSASYVTECLSPDVLCTCDSNVFVQNDCETVCTEAGFDYATECGFSNTSQRDVCFCDYDEEPVGTCNAPIVVTQLPFMQTTTTEGLADNYDGYYCEDSGGSTIGGGYAGENVYLYHVTGNEANGIDVIVQPNDSGFDPILTVRSPCTNSYYSMDFCYGADSNGSGETEGMALTFDWSGDLYIMVDGYGSLDEGSYTILVREHVK